MKKIFVLTAVCAALTACGGGSGGGNGGSDPAPSPTPTVNCALPTIASSTTYYGVTPAGDTGTWNFTQNGSTLTVSNIVTAAFGSTQNNTFTATASSNNCTFTTTSSSIQGIATAFNGDLAMSASQNGNRPAFLIANPTTTQSSLVGTYNIVNFEKDIGGTPTSSYRQLVIDTGGSTGTIYKWSNGTKTARHVISLTPSGQGFTIAIEPNAQFPADIHEVVGTAYFKISGSSQIIALAVSDTDTTVNPNVQTTGMWIGSTDSTTFPAGGYADNNYDDGQQYNNAWSGGVDVTTTTVQPANQSAITYQANAPQTGFLGIPFDSNQPVDSLISSALGFFAATTQYDSAVGPVNSSSGPNITFAIRPQQ